MWTVTLPLVSDENVMIFRELEMRWTVILLILGLHQAWFFKSYGFFGVNFIVLLLNCRKIE